MMSEEYKYEYHSDELDLTGDPETGDWSIRCVDVHKRLGGVPVLNGLTVAFPDDTITVVLGPSGTGKSVLIKHLIGLMFPDSGDIVVHGEHVPKLTMPKLLALRQRIGVLFQDGALFGSMSVFDNVAFPLRQHTDKGEAEIAKIVTERLTDVGLADAMDDAPSQLSGGMRKRAGFARALVMEPDIVIFDEPDSLTVHHLQYLWFELVERRSALPLVFVVEGFRLGVGHTIFSGVLFLEVIRDAQLVVVGGLLDQIFLGHRLERLTLEIERHISDFLLELLHLRLNRSVEFLLADFMIADRGNHRVGIVGPCARRTGGREDNRDGGNCGNGAQRGLKAISPWLILVQLHRLMFELPR